MDLDASIKPFIKRDGTGSIQYGQIANIKCYAEGKVTVVTDRTGAEVVSDKQLYIDGSISISELDSVTFESSEYSIKSIGTFYTKGKPDMRVVYL